MHSSCAYIENGGNYNAGNRRGRNIHFGVREHAMGAIVNGISLYEDFLPFCSTFLAFSNYMLPSIRMSAMMKLNIMYFFTHDSIYVGQDGPSHQPIEQLSQLRSIIGLKVFRPCDASELLAGYKFALSNKGPIAFVLSRQNMPIVDGKFNEACQGGYILKQASKDADVVIYASGSEVSLALNVARELSKNYSVSVVSFPCVELFEEQSTAYKNKVLQKSARLRVAIEASNDNVWYKYVGDDGLVVGVSDYQKSADGKTIYNMAGFNEKDIVRAINKKLSKKD